MKNDQKKSIVLGVLVVLVLAIGAFQFMPKGDSAAAAAALAAKNKAAAGGAENDASVNEENGEATDETAVAVDENGQPTDENGNVVVKTNAAGQAIPPMPARDPFQVPSDIVALNNAPVQEKVVPTTEPKPVHSGQSPRGNQPVNPEIFGSFPPLTGGGTPSGPIGVPAPSGPNVRLMGVLVGDKPMAVFEDDKGNQKLVPLGGSVDGDTKVTSIKRGQVTISHRGKDKTLVIQEEAHNDN